MRAEQPWCAGRFLLAPLHRLVDEIAMSVEDFRYRPASPFSSGPASPLDCFGPLPPLPAPPGGPTWDAPSPRAVPGDARMRVAWTAAHGERRGTVVLVPPWKLPRLSLLGGWTAALARSGNEVWTLIPPLHLQRTPPGRRSGEAFVTPDLPALRAVMEQLVLEIRLLLALAHGRGLPVGMLGLSLGGLAAALAASSPEAPARAALVAPPADLYTVAAETRIGRRLLPPARAGDVASPPSTTLRELLLPFRADARPPRAGRILVAVGRADAIASPAAAAALAQTSGAELRAYRRGHLTLLFACPAVRRDVAAFLTQA